MEIFQAVFLGIVQGLTEFLPISSSGHLILIPSVLGWEDFTNNLIFDVALHVGTALAVLVFFWADWLRISKSFLGHLTKPKEIISDFDSRLLLLIVVGTIPAVIIGLSFKDLIVEQFRQPQVVAITLILFAALLFFADRVGIKTRDMSRLNLKDAIFVGLAQALALIPGVSRSGITITTALFTGLDREAAARFSFMLSTPVIFGAAVLSFKDAYEFGYSGFGMGVFLVGLTTSAVVGWLAIKYLLKYISTHNYNVFVWYRVVIGISALLFFL